MTAREASIFACVVDTFVAPEGVLPPVARTDAARFFGDWLALGPRRNALGLRALLLALELGPLALGFGQRLRRLPTSERARYIKRLERLPPVKALKGIAFLSYYGDDALMNRLGYDADANVSRGRALRAREGRP
jgi:hypothetical protein